MAKRPLLPAPAAKPSAPPVEPLLVSADVAAPLLSVSKRTLSDLVRAGEVPSVKIGRRRLFPVDGLRDWTRQRTEGGRR